MKKFSIVLFILFIQLFFLNISYSKVYDAYFKKATLKENGEYKYEERMKRKEIKELKNTPYFVIGYSKRKRVYEKHYSSSNKLTFYAKYSYQNNKAYTKMEFLIYQRELKIKIKDPELLETNRGVYNKIKYLKLHGKDRKIYKVEEYHSNGMLHIVSHFSIYNGQLEKTENYDREGIKTLEQQYRYIDKKRYLWKELKYDKDNKKKKGHWHIYYDSEGKETDKQFYPIIEKKDPSS